MKYKCFKFVKFSLIILLFTVSNADFLISQSGKTAGMKVNVVSTSSNSTTLEFILQDYESIPIDIAGNEFMQYYVPGSIFLMERGFPQLPTHRTSIIISDDAGVKYNIIDQQFSFIQTAPVAPSKGHFTRDIDPESVPYVFDNFYNSTQWFPQSNILLDEPYVLRDLRGLTVQFNPMQYNPAEGQLKICTRLVVEVIENVNVPAVNPLQRFSPLDGVSKEFNDIYSSLFINYGHSYYDYVPLQETGRLLIVYPTAFASNITPFVEWKQQKGFQTILAEYPTATGTGNAALKSYIQNLYNTPESVTFIVLVGESNQIPTMSGQYESAPSDPSYVKLAGSDAYPDAFISRISPSSASNLDYVLHKLIRYEKFPDTGTDAEWYLKGTGVASNEGSPPDWQRANWLRDMLINNMHFTHVDQIYEPSATKLQITNAINNGRSIINYIGHGSGTS